MKTCEICNSTRKFAPIEEEIVRILIDEPEVPGRELRQRIRNRGFARTLAAFYQLLSQMENEGFVKCRISNVVENDQPLKIYHYSIAEKGVHFAEYHI